MIMAVYWRGILLFLGHSAPHLTAKVLLPCNREAYFCFCQHQFLIYSGSAICFLFAGNSLRKENKHEKERHMIDINEVLGNDVIFRVEKAALMNFQGIYLRRQSEEAPNLSCEHPSVPAGSYAPPLRGGQALKKVRICPALQGRTSLERSQEIPCCLQQGIPWL